MSPFDSLLVWLGGGVCSQIPSHSFWFNGSPLPLCARDLGLFGAFLLAQPFARGACRWSWLCGFAPLLLDGANSFAFEAFNRSLYQPSNALRLATGLLAGVSLAMLLRSRLDSGLCHAERSEASDLGARIPRVARNDKGFPIRPFTSSGVLLGVAALGLLSPPLLLALLGSAGVLALIAAANLLARPALSRRLAWAMALPELAVLAGAKHVLLAALR